MCTAQHGCRAAAACGCGSLSGDTIPALADRPEAIMARRTQTLPKCAFIALIACCVCTLIFQAVAWPAASNEKQRRVFLLEGLTPTQPAGMQTLEAFRNRLKEKGAEDVETFIDFLELGRFPGPAHEARTARFLSEKFAEKPPDLLVPISRGALAFVMPVSRYGRAQYSRDL